MNKPEVVVFDLGKVLVDFDYSIAARKIAAQAERSAAQVQELLDHSPLLFRFEHGHLTAREFFEAVRGEAKFRGSYEEFTAAFADIFSEMPRMVRLHADLRAQQVPTFIFSNTNELAIHHVRRNFPFFANFTGYIFSYEHGAMKPDARLYEVVERTTGRHGAGILYIDDRAENVVGGTARGWQTIWQETPEKTVAAMQALGF